MAIVKFISDQDCHIFIDKENVGKVTVDSLLKVALEVGGYLIEVKDDGGRILKKYNLEIKSTDNQILQDVSGASPSTDEVLNLLKNDPTLVFHCGRAKFCLEGKYGYVNKKFEVVIPAIYSIANDFVNNKAFVVRDFPEGRKTTMIDEEGNMFFNRWFDYIGESDEIILLGIDNRIIVYSKTKNEKITEYFNAGYNFVYPLVPVFRKIERDYYYGFIDFSGNEIIPLLFDYVWNFDKDGKTNVAYWGRIASLNSKGELSLIFTVILENDDEQYVHLTNGDLADVFCEYNYQYGYQKWSSVTPIWKDNKWYIKVDDISKKLIECERILFIGDGCYAYRKDGKCVVRLLPEFRIVIGEENPAYFDYDFVIPVNGSGDYCDEYNDPEYYLKYCIVRVDNKFGVVSDRNITLIPFEYDYIIPIELNPGDWYFLLEKNALFSVEKVSDRRNVFPTEFEHYYWDDHLFLFSKNSCGVLMKDKALYANYDYIMQGWGKSFIVSKNGKFGVINEDGVEIIPLFYDTIEKGGQDTFVVSKAGMCGIIDGGGTEILPLYYEDIVFLGEEYYKVMKKDCWSLGRLHNPVVFKEKYDEISLISKYEKWIDIFLVKVGNKCGCVNNKSELLLSFVYDRIELGPSLINPKVYSLITYKDNKVGFFYIAYFYSNDYYSKKTKSHNFEYVYCVEPQFDECWLFDWNKDSVLDHYNIHYAAVRKGNKWGILDQKPRDITYKAIDINLEDEYEPNFSDLEFKYNSLVELRQDADNEFQRRLEKYYHPYSIDTDSNGDSCIVEEE